MVKQNIYLERTPWEKVVVNAANKTLPVKDYFIKSANASEPAYLKLDFEFENEYGVNVFVKNKELDLKDRLLFSLEPTLINSGCFWFKLPPQEYYELEIVNPSNVKSFHVEFACQD